MLEDYDLELIKETRKQITKNRTHRIKLKGQREVGRHPLTDEPITEPFEETVSATVRELSSRAQIDIRLESGIYVREGDLKISIDLDDLPFPIEDVKTIEYMDVNYTILSSDRLGLGEHNRVVVLARRER